MFHVTVEEKATWRFLRIIFFKAKGDNDEDYVLRLTHSSHRSKQEVEAELDFFTICCGEWGKGSRTSLFNVSKSRRRNRSRGWDFLFSLLYLYMQKVSK